MENLETPLETTDRELEKETRRDKRLRDHSSRQQIREEKNERDVISGMSRAEFEKKFPHLPLDIWYGRHRLTGDFLGY